MFVLLFLHPNKSIIYSQCVLVSMCGISTDKTPEEIDAIVESMQERGYDREDIMRFLMCHPHPMQASCFIIDRGFIERSVETMRDASYTQKEIDAWLEDNPVGELHGFVGII